MTKKSNAKPSPADYKNKAVEIKVKADRPEEFAAAVARTLTRPEVTAAAVIEAWQQDTHDVNQLIAALAEQVSETHAGSLLRAEAQLISQAHALDNIFCNLARRVVNQEFLKQWEVYLRMALKAQNQCRMTLETLAAIKNPPVVYARQANINNGGQQQVNNGAVSQAITQESDPPTQTNSLSQESAPIAGQPITFGSSSGESAKVSS